ncbi:MAG: DUF6427 family protein [Flavobacteriaceae bacterium]|nr:DUF6427 family protein [Flavobacteriaceae bacterium]MDG1284423.1 DUF6427 family protein [Flavobacteriaceae bacterium]
MITSFFKTSKPIHYIIFLIVLICLFVYQRIIIVNYQGNLSNTLNEIGDLLILLASFFTLIFIVTKNNLTYNNGYAALYFCLFIGLIPSCLEENSILLSNLFILLSFRRIMSLKTNSNIKKKLLDASMWICLAAIFEPWAILFFLVLFFGMVFYSVTQIKNTMIPFCGILAVAILLTSYRLLTENAFPSVTEFLPTLRFDNTSFNNTITKTESLQFLAVVLFGIVSFFGKVVLKNRLKIPSVFVILLAILIGITMVFINSNHGASRYYLFAFAPTSIILANFSETTMYRWLSDLVIGLLLFAVLIQWSLNISFLIN